MHVNSTPASTICTLSSSPALTTIWPSDAVPEIMYVPALEIVAVDVALKSIFVAEDSSYSAFESLLEYSRSNDEVST